MLVTDPRGQRTGVGPNGSVIEDIVGSQYQPAVGEEDFDSDPVIFPNGPKSVIIDTPAAGLYRVDLVGTGTGPYALDWSRIGANGALLSEERVIARGPPPRRLDLWSELWLSRAAMRAAAALGRVYSSGIPALRRPAKYVFSKRARTVGTPKYPNPTAFKRAILE